MDEYLSLLATNYRIAADPCLKMMAVQSLAMMHNAPVAPLGENICSEVVPEADLSAR